jgi:hypothetical protein
MTATLLRVMGHLSERDRDQTDFVDLGGGDFAQPVRGLAQTS